MHLPSLESLTNTVRSNFGLPLFDGQAFILADKMDQCSGRKVTLTHIKSCITSEEAKVPDKFKTHKPVDFQFLLVAPTNKRNFVIDQQPEEIRACAVSSSQT